MLAETVVTNSLDARLQIEQEQTRKLRLLLEEVEEANRFYARKLTPLTRSGSSITLESFSRQVPFTTKHELVKDRLENPPYGTGLTYAPELYVRCHQTSGSTAVPIRWLDTKESWDGIVFNWVRILAAAGVQPTDRFFFAFSFGPFLGFWSAIEAVHQLGCFCFPGGGMSSVARLQAILDNEITVLCCTPTYAQYLGQTAREKGVGLSSSKVRLIIVAGEAGGSIPATRARIESLWPGAFVFDHHGMTEVGPVTYQCPAEAGLLHVLESAYFPEVIDPRTSAATEPGGTGELVLTTLDRIGSPLLRYRTGDLVRPRAPGICRCGTTNLALEGGILGRADDMVVVRGVNVYPSSVEEIVRACPEITEYRVQVDSRGPMLELRLDIETSPECGDAAAVRRQLEDGLHHVFNLRVPVTVVKPGVLPRYEMKARRWVRLTEGMV